jgi:hypothetical protein|tara:strand:+ start:4206 stop:4382 length:177 start_codon:yes stop_codon:yes gene_type:complete
MYEIKIIDNDETVEIYKAKNKNEIIRILSSHLANCFGDEVQVWHHDSKYEKKRMPMME